MRADHLLIEISKYKNLDVDGSNVGISTENVDMKTGNVNMKSQSKAEESKACLLYTSFYKNVGETPNGYRKRNQEKK